MKWACSNGKWCEDQDGIWVLMRVRDRATAIRVVQSIQDKTCDVEIKEHREKRSLDANRYLWVLLDELAAALGSTKEDVYRLFVRKVGLFRDFHLSPEEAPSFEVAWSMIGTGWLTEQVDYTSNGEQLVIRAYYGSSQYNTKRMARLIDMVVEDCKTQGIETKPPWELEGLKARWGRG